MAKTTDNTTILSRPRRKPDSSVKGKLNRWNNTDYCEFVPAGTRESNRTEIKRLGNSSFYRSEGEKDSSYSLHLNVDGNSQDPVAEMFDIFMHLTEDQRKQLPQLPEGSHGRMLYDDKQNLQIWHDTEANKLTILTQLECSADIERQLLQAQAQMNVVLGRFRKDIINNNK